jgi:2,3-bisphosphoglycerate-dependent phosphoglycerate mutase
VFCSDSAHAAQTAALAFGNSGPPVLQDWRLRECDYGHRSGMAMAEWNAGRREHLDRGLEHHPGGVPLEELAGRDFAWQAGWECVLR